MRKEIDRKILHFAMIEIEGGSSLCEIDTVVRIEDDEKKLFDCKDCVYKEVADICPELIKKDIKGILKLR